MKRWILAVSLCLFGIHLLDSFTKASALCSDARSHNSKTGLPDASRRKSPALWRDDLVPPELPKQPLLIKPPEVMAPAGGWPQLRAAVANGADSVYLGLEAYSARARATNFGYDELKEAVDYCHSYGVQVYVTLNTLVFEHELEELVDVIKAASVADAVIVQDVGLCRLIREVAPDMVIHASTQQTVTSADGVDFCADVQGATRVVLGRELSVREIEQITASTNTEIETFVHGALCVSYSGQCFSSEAWGGRSANRGQCAQACRLPYGLIVNNELKDLQDMSYLLSPQDLCGLEHVKALTSAGVSCLKIEGRLKDENYVAATTRAYRNAVDVAWEELSMEGKLDPAAQMSTQRVDKHVDVHRHELAQVFSRGQDAQYDGLSAGFFGGSQHQALVRGRSPRHRGLHMGTVLPGISPDSGLIVQLDDEKKSLKRGDGIVIDRGMPETTELAGPIYSVVMEGNLAHICFGRDVTKQWTRLDKEGLCMTPDGAHVWKTSDATVQKKLSQLASSKPQRASSAISVQIVGKVGERLQVLLSDGQHVGVGFSEQELQKAETQLLSPERIEKAIGTLGDTEFTITGSIDATEFDPDAWCPVSAIKGARRQSVVDLIQKRGCQVKSKPEISFSEATANDILDQRRQYNQSPSTGHTRLSVLVRLPSHVDVVCYIIRSNPISLVHEVIVDFLEIEGVHVAVEQLRKIDGLSVVIASPRIIKAGEEGIWRTLMREEPDGLLIRSAGLLKYLQEARQEGDRVNVGTVEQPHWVNFPSLIGDFSLNVANPLTAHEYITEGADRITASFDLNSDAITQMAKTLKGLASSLDVVVHTKMPIFHTEHCVFARFLSKGNSYKDCGHVCTRNTVHLRDENGADNLVLADMGCRNTVFAAQSQSGVHSIEQWKAANVGTLRIELVDEQEDDVESIISGYEGVLNGSLKPSTVWQSLQTVRDSNGRAAGVCLGSLRNQAERRAGAIS